MNYNIKIRDRKGKIVDIGGVVAWGKDCLTVYRVIFENGELKAVPMGDRAKSLELQSWGPGAIKLMEIIRKGETNV